MSKQIIFDRKTTKENSYYLATWHNYGRDRNLQRILELAKEAKVVLELPDTSVHRLPVMLYCLRGGSVLRQRVLDPREKYENFGKVIVYEIPRVDDRDEILDTGQGLSGSGWIRG